MLGGFLYFVVLLHLHLHLQFLIHTTLSLLLYILVHPILGKFGFCLCFCCFFRQRLNELMESKGGKKKSSSSGASKSSLFYEAPLGYSIEDIRPAGGIKKYRSAAYSNVSCILVELSFFWFLLIQMNGLLILLYLVLFMCSALGNHPEISRVLT